jgi:hypothetical protein
MSNKLPIIWKKNKAKLLNSGPLEFLNGVQLDISTGDPTGQPRKKGSFVLDQNSNIWQAIDDFGGYQTFLPYNLTDLKAYFDTLYMPIDGESSMEYANKYLTGSESLLPNEQKTLVDYTIPTGYKFRFLSGSASSDGDVEVEVYIDAVKYILKRTSYNLRDVDVRVPLEITAGAHLIIKAKNVTLDNETNVCSCFLYGKEVAI